MRPRSLGNLRSTPQATCGHLVEIGRDYLADVVIDPLGLGSDDHLVIGVKRGRVQPMVLVDLVVGDDLGGYRRVRTS